jgi:hypothetical protein
MLKYLRLPIRCYGMKTGVHADYRAWRQQLLSTDIDKCSYRHGREGAA